ncbi:MAG: glycerate kinase [Candidatus Rokubacteria bacterium]|nr:glycerate kinase [Candidatus Rokubacteria bacterium]
MAGRSGLWQAPAVVTAGSDGERTGREALLAVWQAALAAGDPAPLVAASLRVDGGTLRAGPFALDLAALRRVIVLGCGKAGGAMAQAVEAVLGDRISAGFVVVKDGYTKPTRRIRLAEARHPVPDARGQAAAETLVALAESAGADDLVLFLVSGGGSALTPAPAPPVTLEEKQSVTRLLLAAGATIGELNAVRKHLSRVKGGRLARAAAPARLVTLALSDVIGDPLDVIASGPTAPDPTMFRDALDVLERRGVRARVPGSVRARLDAGARGEIEETPKPGDPLFARVANVVIGNNTLVTDAALAAAQRLGLRPALLTRALEGEAREVARDVVARIRSAPRGTCLIAGGETTVTVRGGGSGGRCQEFALAAAVELAGTDDVVVLAAGTDGTDGPTDAAGAVVDGTTVARAAARGLDAAGALDANDAGTLLAATADLIITGPTNTNLLDLYVALRT